MIFKMKRNVLFSLFFVAYTKGNTETECAEAEGKFLKCKFSKNINITKTGFSAYFHSVTGHEELLLDCGWMGDQLHCIEQEGVNCKEPVSDFAEISVPARFANRDGTYRCVDEGSHLENCRPCQFNENTPERVPNMQRNATKSDRDLTLGNKSLSTTLIVIVTVTVIIAVITMVFCYKLASRIFRERYKAYPHTE